MARRHRSTTTGTINETVRGGNDTMHDMMNSMDGMMWGMGLVGLLAVLVLILAAAALIKYLFFR